MVSAIATSTGSPGSTARTTRMTCSVLTSPSNGQPNAADTVTDAGTPAARDRSSMRTVAARTSLTPAPWLRCEKVSVVTATRLTSSTPAASARSRPRSLSTRPMWSTWLPSGAVRGTAAMTSSAPAI